MALYVIGKWVGIHFYDMVPQFSTVYFVFSKISKLNFNMMWSLSRYHFNIKTVHICQEYVDKIS